jgi:NDP-sugar pyrophosphorylase family protein
MNFGVIRERDKEKIKGYNLSDIPVLIFAGGEGKRMWNFSYVSILPSKEWLLVPHENNKLVPLFWRIFEISVELGFEEIYIIITKEGEKVKKFFEREFKGKDINIELLNKKTLSKKTKLEGKTNIYIFEQKGRGTASALSEMKRAINGRIFLEIFGDEYFGGEKEKIKNEVVTFINFAVERIKQNDALKVEAFVKKERVISRINDEEKRYYLKEDEQIDTTKNSNLVVTSLSLSSPKIIDIYEKKKIKDFNTSKAQQELIKTGKIYGRSIDPDFFANINREEDYFALRSHLDQFYKSKNNKLLKLR